MSTAVSTAGWIKGIAFSSAASVFGAVSKLCIRKSYTTLQKQAFLCGFGEITDKTIAGHSEGSFDKDADGIICDQSYGSDYASMVDPEKIPMSVKVEALLLRSVGFFGMTVLNPFCCIYAMKFASPSILAPFSGLTLVWVVLFSEITIEEKPSTNQIFAASLIVLGEVIVAIWGDHTNVETLQIEDIRSQYSDPSFVAYFIFLMLWMMLLVTLINCRRKVWRRFAWGVAGGSVTGLQNFVKDAMALMDGSEGTTYTWEVYALIFCGVFFPLLGLLLLMECMKRYDATYSSSMFVGSFVISASIMSAIHYHSFENLNNIWNHLFYPLGLLILLSGTVILATEAKIKSLSATLRDERILDTPSMISSNCQQKSDNSAVFNA